VPRLLATLERHAPGWIAFNGKKAAEAALGRPVGYGRQPERLGPARVCLALVLRRGAWFLGRALLARARQDDLTRAAHRALCGNSATTAVNRHPAAWLIERDKLYAATIVSLVAYQGLRIPEEVLAREVRHVRTNTLLIEQRNIKGKIVPGQKVRHSRPRSPRLLDPVRRDVTKYLMATGIGEGRLFPRQDGEPWKVHDYKNWTRRVWKNAREGAGIESMPPYDLRHAYASLRIRAGASIPELAEELGHSPQMTVRTYTHVIRELQGEPVVSAEEQIELARSGALRAREASGA